MTKETEMRKNMRIEQEFTNPVYDVMGEAISKTAEKHNYGKYDIAKLVMAIYDGDFDYLTSDDDYREQVKLLDEYFEKTYKHKLITFEMIKTIKAFEGTDIYEALTADVAAVETMVRYNKNVPAEDLCIFSEPLEDNRYDELMAKIENEKSLRYAVAVVYDKIKNTKK